MAQGRQRHEPARSADELEQRQRPDGTFEDEPEGDEAAEPLSPDVLEQRRRADGELDPPGAVDASDEPLTPDMIEQRQVVEEDDEDGRETE